MRAMQLQDVLVLLCSLPNQQQIYICLKQTHLRIEALGHDVVVVRRLLGHGGQWGTRGAFLGLVNEEPICRIENSNCGKFELHVSYEKYRERQNFQHIREDTNTGKNDAPNESCCLLPRTFARAGHRVGSGWPCCLIPAKMSGWRAKSQRAGRPF